jgi:hypothetical protein
MRWVFERSLTPVSGGDEGDKGMAGECLDVADMRGGATPPPKLSTECLEKDDSDVHVLHVLREVCGLRVGRKVAQRSLALGSCAGGDEPCQCHTRYEGF